jgi:hypothetical protein
MNAISSTSPQQQVVDHAAKPEKVNPVEAVQAGLIICGGIASLATTVVAAEILAKRILGQCLPEGKVYGLCSYECNIGYKCAFLSLGLYTLSASLTLGPWALKKMVQKVNQQFGKGTKTPEVDPKDKDQIRFAEKINDIAAGFFPAVMGLSGITELLGASMHTFHASYQYLFTNCEACKWSIGQTKVHLLAATALLALSVTPALISAAARKLTPQPKPTDSSKV